MPDNTNLIPRISPTCFLNKKDILQQDTLFSRYTSMPLDDKLTRRNNNVFVFAPSKEASLEHFVKPNILQCNSSYVIHDKNGALLRSLGPDLERMGYEIRVLNLSEPEKSHHYNPFCYLRDGDVWGVFDLASIFVPAVVDFWAKSEWSLICALFAYIKAVNSQDKQTIENVRQLISCRDKNNELLSLDASLAPLDAHFNELEKREPNHRAVKAYRAFRYSPEKMQSSVLVSCMTLLNGFALPEVDNLTSDDNIDLYSVGDKKVALFCIPNKEYPFLNLLITMLYTQLIASLMHQAETWHKHRLPVHVRFMVPNINDIGIIPDFSLKLGTLRPYNISVSFYDQDIGSAKKAFGDSWPTLSANCDTFLFLGLNPEQTDNDNLRTCLTGWFSNPVRDLRIPTDSSEPISTLSPDILFNLHPDDCAVLVRGSEAVLDKKYDLRKHPNYSLLHCDTI